MKFNYQVRTKKGEVQTGVVEASSKEVALSLLQQHGYYITYLEEAKMPFYARKVELMSGISHKDIVLLSRQLSMMFGSKIPLVESLRILGSQTKKAQLREQLLNISEEVEGGSPFSKALARHPKTFSILYIAMVRAGETAGKLSETLTYLADHLEREYNLMSKTKGALVYPSLIFMLTMGVMSLMVNMVVPQLKMVLKETQAEIPPLTQTVISISGLLKDYGLFFIIGFLAVLFLLYRYYKTKNGKDLFDRIFLKLPIIGPFLKIFYLSRIAESLATLLSGGLMLTQALELSADIAGSSIYKKPLI